MKHARNALLGACLALPLALQASPAAAAGPDGGLYVYVPAGASVVILPDPVRTVVASPAIPADFPMAPMIAAERSMLQRMMADMDALMAMPLPDPQQMIRSVAQGMPQAVPGTAVVMTSISGGRGTCSETVTYRYAGAGQPEVKVTRSGDACGAFGTQPATEAAAPLPVPPQAVPQQPRDREHPRLWSVGYPPQPLTGKPKA